MNHAQALQEELRSAASTLRRTAEQATPGPWAPADGSIPYGHRVGTADQTDWVAWTGAITEERSEADAAHIATMHPGVSNALADWLDLFAATEFDPEADVMETDRRHECALAVARAINGGAQ